MRSRARELSPAFRRAAALPLVLFIAGGAPLPSAWKYWRYSRAIELPPAEAPRLASVTAPAEAFASGSYSLADVRVIDDRAREIPYVRFERGGAAKIVSLATTLHERSFAEGHYTQVVIDIGGQAPFHNAVEIQTPETDYIEWVRVDASDDARLWRLVQPRAPIFHFQKEGHRGTQTVPYSENNAKFLRLQILDGEKQFPVSGANVLHQITEPPERALVPANMKPASQPPAGRSVWTADLGAASPPISEIKFEVAAPAEFIRFVEISASADNKEWQLYPGGEIYRCRQGDAVAEQLSIDVPHDSPYRYWRVEIVNHNDAPLSGAIPHLYTTPRHVIFVQQPGRSYRLIYGQHEAKWPQYDLARRLQRNQMVSAVPAELGPEEINSAWADPRPWTEQHDALLWVMLAGAVILIGYAALRSLRRSAAANSASSE
ncbi:MAG TPA: DUF3999 family protein [Candidatus Sulfotelmatobacter sp.]|nr:DUF3999 family protein [Candidatus Sulfotelmatobacter sp.]